MPVTGVKYIPFRELPCYPCLVCAASGPCLLDDAFRVADEVDDVVYLIAHGHLVFNLLQGILYAEVALVYQTVGVHDVSQDTLGHHVLVLQHHGVHSVVFGGIASHNDVWGHVFGNAASALYQRPDADVAILLQQHVAAQYDAAVNAAFACYGGLDAQHAVVGYLYVVAQVYAVHQIVFITDTCALAFVCSAADDYVLAYVVSVANDELCFFTRVVEVLRLCAQHGSVVHLVSFSHTGAAQYPCARHDDAVVANLYIAFNIGKRLYGYVLADFGCRVYIS